jgi:hypothetical protein
MWLETLLQVYDKKGSRLNCVYKVQRNSWRCKYRMSRCAWLALLTLNGVKKSEVTTEQLSGSHPGKRKIPQMTVNRVILIY